MIPVIRRRVLLTLLMLGGLAACTTRNENSNASSNPSTNANAASDPAASAATLSDTFAGTLAKQTDVSMNTPHTDSLLALLTAPKTWQLAELRGQLVLAGNKTAVVPTIIFTPDMRVTGRSGCNSYSGTFTLGPAKALRISPLMMTRMMCPDIAIENEYTQVLGFVDHVTVSATSLTLERTGMPTMARFVPWSGTQ